MKLTYDKPVNPFEKGHVFPLEQSVEYSAGGVISKQITKSSAGNVTLFSFDEGQGLTEHTSPFDAMVQILDGEADIVLDGQSNLMKTGECIIMPAGIPHALVAVKPFKMLLTMIKG